MIVAIIGVLLLMLVVAGTLGALFGVVWWQPVKQHGIWMLLSAWLFSMLVVAALGVLRSTVALRHAASAPGASRFPSNLFLFYAAVVGVTLVPTAAALHWRVRRRPDSSFATVLLSSAAWAMAGVVFMFFAVIRFELTRLLSNR
ncbi:MAG: hypothetical protein ACJ79K_03480 [Gemmatimonadaceae bacterium]